MFPQKRPIVAPVESETYPLGEKSEHSSNGHELALVALSHTQVEHRLYSAMLPANSEADSVTFSARRLMALTGIRSLSTIRRGLEGLLLKLSIERDQRIDGKGTRELGATYRAFAPDQIITRRNACGGIHGKGMANGDGNYSFARAVARVAENKHLSRREAQVALCCVEGLTNADIGNRLQVSEQTVKFHLRHVFVKFGVKRRTELISRLLM